MIDIATKLKLRSATDKDSGLVYKIKKIALGEYVKQIWGWDEEWQLNFHKRTYKPEFLSIVQFDNQEIGTLGRRRDKAENIFWLENIHLLPDYHNKGIGSTLIRMVIDEATTNNLSTRLQVLKNNPAINLYKRFKFVECDRTDSHILMERVDNNGGL